MKMFVILLSIVFSLAGVLASPYLEFCKPLDLQVVGSQGIVIQASCGGQCHQLNIVPCFSNSYGTISPAGST